MLHTFSVRLKFYFEILIFFVNRRIIFLQNLYKNKISLEPTISYDIFGRIQNKFHLQIFFKLVEFNEYFLCLF
jgi:hypothetical protein